MNTSMTPTLGSTPDHLAERLRALSGPHRSPGAPSTDGTLSGSRAASTRDELAVPSRQRSFAETLSIADRGPLARKSEAREIAESFVAVALVEPALKQARESTWAAPPFAPSQAEKQFASMMDSHVAREVTRAANFPLVDRLARNMRRM